MGGLVIETVRPGVQFTPDAAAAFRRADAQVLAEFGRRIDVNSTYRSWSDQMVMYVDWSRYVASGYRPSLKPNHSKAVHPSQSFHVSGTALDSDDWVNARIVAILAENGFIRNRLHIPNERHHFEYLRGSDKNFGKPTGGGNSKPTPAPVPADLMEAINMAQIRYVHRVEKGYETEWMIVGLEIPGGFQTTSDKTRAEGWGAIYGTDKGGSWKALTRKQYIALQASARELHEQWASMQKAFRS
ncbi:hypothetical protein [Microbacterium sp. NPDC087592]|uniref:hypothetical protein n=1 Tax=Microbacterium sp. NPDC087592 TaxID=3364193 RepID=UPI0038180ED1